MKLAEALRILQAADPRAPEFPVSLVSGSTADPLSSFLAAHLQQALPGRRVRVESGRFDDLAGNLARSLERAGAMAAIVVEWADLDPRLGLRRLGGWGRASAPDILAAAQARLEQLGALLAQAPSGCVLALAPPGLPLPPVLPVPGWQMNVLEAELHQALYRFLARIAPLGSTRVLSPARLLEAAPPAARLDVKSWLAAGFPYRLPYASALAGLLARLLAPPAPAKGIITDLDNTLWAGILGEVGVEHVAWDLERHAAIHGVYQQFLESLAREGVLVAAASKNDPALVRQVFARPDLLLRPESVFPVEAHWQPKAQSVARILRAWNIGPDAVLFLDDSAMEVAEIQAAFPAMDCRLFPAQDPDAVLALLADLADRCGKASAREEDTLRLSSLRAAAGQQQLEAAGLSHESILRSAEGLLTLTPLTVPADPRALELVNKTNQFNLNGRRYTEAEWLACLRAGGARAWIAAYRDRFGPLGKIAVLAGQRHGACLEVKVWVMSCRAFSRRIEHALARFLFEREAVEEIVLDFQPTERNGPLREFLAELAGSAPAGPVRLSRAAVAPGLPPVYLKVELST